MKLKFKAKGTPQPAYTISGETINGIDLSQFPDGGQFVGDESTHAAGIYGVTRVDGELVVTLAQRGLAYEFPVDSHDWRGNPDLLVDAADFSNNACYIVATCPKAQTLLSNESAYYKRIDDGWTVALVEVVQ